MEWSERVTEVRDRLSRIPADAARARLADKYRIPYSQVLEQWSDADLIVVEALEQIRYDDAMARCGQCGVDPAEMDTVDGRPSDHALWRLDVSMCETCADREELLEKLNKETPSHRRYTARWVPRSGDEPIVPDV